MTNPAAGSARAPLDGFAAAGFRQILDTVLDAVLVVRGDGMVIFANGACERIFGYPPGDLAGRPVDVLVPAAARAGHPERVRRYTESPVQRPMGGGMDLSAVRRDGTMFPAEVSLSSVTTPQGVLVTAVVRDVTAQRHRAELERRLRESDGLETRRRAERDQHIAAVLQEALVPDVPRQVDRVAVAARYLPAAGEAVGGDWVDVFRLPSGCVGVTVGDVAGHGIGSASTMSRLRYALRALANTGAGPAEVVTQLNQAMHLAELTSADIEIATVVHAQFDPRDGTLRHCSAGHPPLLCRDPDGVLSRLPASSGPPIGVVPDAVYAEHARTTQGGSVLVGYTDGLVERPDRGFDVALDQFVTGLLSGLAAMRPDGRQDVERLADAVLAAAPSGRREDDTALVVLSLPPLSS